MKKNLLAIAAFALLLTSCETKLVEKVDLIPLAENVEIHKGAFPLSNLQSIQVPDEWKLTADNFVKDLQKTASLTVSLTASGGSLVIVKDESLSAEAYRLNIRNFGGPGHTLFYRYDCDGQSQYMNTNLKNGKNSPDFSKMSLKEAKGFAYNMIVYTYMEEQRQNENYCGGDVEIFSIQRDEIAHTKESVTWMSNQS